MTPKEYQSLDGKVDRILDYIEKQNDINLLTERRVTAIETTQKEQRNTAAKWASAIGAIVAAIISGLAATWRHS